MNDTTWRHYIPTRVCFGPGALNKLPELLNSYPEARRVLAVTGREYVVKSGLWSRVKGAIESSGKEPYLYNGVPPEPSIYAVEKAISEAKEISPHVILGVGGGSALDVAKLVSMLLINEGDLRSIVGVYEPFGREGIPFFALPTTSGSGSEVTPYAVVIDPLTPRKAPVVSMRSFPKVAIDDPSLTLQSPPGLTARAGVDAFSHGLEAFLSRRSTPISDLLALECIRLALRHLPQVVKNGDTLELREKMMLSSLLGGIAIGAAGAGLIHQLGHALAVYNPLPHGVTMGIFIIPVLKFYGENVKERLALICRGVDVPCDQFLEWLEDWLHMLGMPSLAQVDYREEWAEGIAGLVLSRRSVMEILPKAPTKRDLIELLDQVAKAV